MANDLAAKKIRDFASSGHLRWTNHVLVRILQRDIKVDDIKSVLNNGEIIENYPDDYPYPSYLILGISLKNAYIHVVCGIAETELWLITAYFPNPAKWSADFKIRKD